MSRESFDYTHGDQGAQPSSGAQFEANERPDSEHFDWFWYNVIESINGHADEFDRIDSDNDGVVDAADGAATYSDDGSVLVTYPTDINLLDKLHLTDDGDNTVSISTTALDEEEVEDVVNALLSAGDKLSWSYDDVDDILTLTTTALDTEEVEDQVNSLLDGGSHISLAYSDDTNTLTLNGDGDADTFKGNDLDSDGDGVVNEADYANDADASTFKGKDLDSDGDGTVDNADYANDADASTFKGNDLDSDGDGTVDNADEVNGHAFYVQSTAPSSPNTNDVWIDTS